MKKLVHAFNGDYGEIGSYCGYGEYCVGDVVEIKSAYSGASTTIICEKDGKYFAYGWKPRSLESCEIKNQMIKLHSYKELDKDLMKICKYKLFIV